MNPVYIAQRINQLENESAFEVLAKAKALEAQGHSVVRLEIGQPDFKTPENIINAAYNAMKGGFTGYTPTVGLPEARKAISEYVTKYKNVPAEAENVIVVPGGKPIMFFAMLALINPGDEVIYPDPGFPIYRSCIKFAGGVPVPMPILEENDFRADVEGLKALVTDKTKMIIINNPANPTGGIFTKEDIKNIADFLKDKDIFVLSDEVYDRIVFDDEIMSIASIPYMKDKTIILDSFSKTYAMPGWRIGYGVANKDIIAQIELLMVNSNSCAAAFSQIAAIEALTGPQDKVAEMASAFKQRALYMAEALNGVKGISARKPRGAFYVFANIKETGLTSKQYAERLLYEGHVAALAGTSFGGYGEGYIRFSCANSLENIKEAVKRIEKFNEKILKEANA